MPRPTWSVPGFSRGSVQGVEALPLPLPASAAEGHCIPLPVHQTFFSRTSYHSITCSQSSQQVTFSIMPISLTLRKLTSSPFFHVDQKLRAGNEPVGVLPAPPFHFVSLLHAKPSRRPVHPISSKGRCPLLFSCHPASSARLRCHSGWPCVSHPTR